jgi:ribosome-binding protein aMBF1 (putative translation factor)
MEYTMTPEQYADKPTRTRILKRIHADANRKPRSPLIIEVGKTLREKREAKKLTLEQLQELTGIGFSYLIQLEKGRSNPTVETLEKLSFALGLELRVEIIRPKNSNQ